MRFGIHAGPQDCSIADLRRLWRIADERGFHWCSVWDHLYSVSDLADPAKPAFEGVATMAALASETKRVRVGCLVFCVCYRPVGLLAKAAVTIDHLSGGRCELGIGAGWNEIEARGFGLPFPSVQERLDLGCDREGRDPRAITRTANLGLALGRDEAQVRRQEESLRLMFGPMTDFVRPGILVGTPPQVIERIRQYAAAGAEWVILALRAPFDWEGLELFIQEVMPAFPD